MAEFRLARGLDSKVANMARPTVRQIAVEVEREAKLLAPPTKTWISKLDNRVRREHRAPTHGQTVPDNLRFNLPSMAWDMGIGRAPKSEGKPRVGPRTYLMRPAKADPQQPFTLVTLINCRCTLQMDPYGVSKLIRIEPGPVGGTVARYTVAAVGPHVVGAEEGETYPGGLVSEGTYFMSRAARRVAARRRARR